MRRVPPRLLREQGLSSLLQISYIIEHTTATLNVEAALLGGDLVFQVFV
jgi:hypothetical protein